MVPSYPRSGSLSTGFCSFWGGPTLLEACCLKLVACALFLFFFNFFWPSSEGDEQTIPVHLKLLYVSTTALTSDLSRCTANYPRILEGTEIRAQGRRCAWAEHHTGPFVNAQTDCLSTHAIEFKSLTPSALNSDPLRVLDCF